MFHAGVSYLTDEVLNQGKRKVDHDIRTNARRAAALLVRMVSLLTLAISSRVPVILICPWRPGEEASALSLRALADRQYGLHSRKYSVNGELEYEVVTNDGTYLTPDSLEAVVNHFISRVAGTEAIVDPAPATPPASTFFRRSWVAGSSGFPW